MAKKFCALILLGYVFICFPGCSYRAWYEGLHEIERQNCYKIESPTERQECLDRIDETSYDQYEKDREQSKNHNKRTIQSNDNLLSANGESTGNAVSVATLRVRRKLRAKRTAVLVGSWDTRRWRLRFGVCRRIAFGVMTEEWGTERWREGEGALAAVVSGRPFGS